MKYYGKYRGELGSANAQQVLNKNNEAWSSFFSLLKLKKEGKLPPHMKPRFATKLLEGWGDWKEEVDTGRETR